MSFRSLETSLAPQSSDFPGHPAPDKPAWFAIFTHPRHEKKVAEHFQGRSIEAFLPAYSSQRTWKNRQTVTLELPLFPNYLFARIRPQQRGSVLSVPGVLSIVGGSRSAIPVPDHYVDTLRKGLALHLVHPHPKAEVGDRVRIVAGPLAGIEGVLAHIRSEFRVVLSIEMIRQCVAIEVARDQVEPLPTRSAAGFGPRSAIL